MEKLEEKQQESEDSALLRSLAIAFPEAKVQEYGIGYMLKVTTSKINLLQFKNLSSISDIYKRDIEIIPAKGKMVITLCVNEEKSHDNPN